MFMSVQKFYNYSLTPVNGAANYYIELFNFTYTTPTLTHVFSASQVLEPRQISFAS